MSSLSFGPAMRLMLGLARARAGGDKAVRALWELAERHHPEQAWLAMSWLCGDRTLAEIERTAPREPVAAALASVIRPGLFRAQELRRGPVLTQE
ncbi:MAG TPA: hypothetical protein VGP07_00585 [Polyangia bacterium]|jgi:hypothetical protein